MLRIAAPRPVNGDILSTQLADAGVPSEVSLNGDVLEIPDLAESDRTTAQAVVDAHPPTAQAALDAAQTERTNETTIRDRAAAALQTNRDFLALASPTNAQTLAQVKALTRQNVGIIRLALRRFDATD